MIPDPESPRSLKISGGCPHCYRYNGGTVVLHDVPWCPEFPAVGLIDSNMLEPDDTIFMRFSRPVEVGELVWLTDYGDGREHPFGTWGRVTEVSRDFAIAKCVGQTPYPSGWCYVEGAFGEDR